MLSTTNSSNDFVIIEPHLVRPPGEETPDFDETSSVSNPYARRVIHRREDDKRGEFSHYMPHKKFIRQASLAQLPQYLYRATHAGSCGVNMEGHYKSRAVANGFGKADFYEFADKEIKISLDDHVSQKNCQTHWISFTDSVITAICRALQFTQKGKRNVRIHVIDTFEIKSLTLIVHSYAMLRGYRVCIGKHPAQCRKLLGSAYAEFLVWDELVVEACSASVTQLMKDGLLELVPELELPIKNPLSNHKRFKQASILRKQLYKGLKTLKEQEWRADRYYSGPRNGWKKEVYVGALPKKRLKHHLYPAPQMHDKRVPLGVHQLNRFRQVARCWRKPQFQLVMLVAMLSMRTDFFAQDDMVDILENMPLEEYAFEDPTFYRTVARTPEKRDVHIFQEMFSEFTMRTRGSGAVKHVRDGKRILLWLNLDPKAVEAETEIEENDRLMSSQRRRDAHSNPDRLTFSFLEDWATQNSQVPGSRETAQG